MKLVLSNTSTFFGGQTEAVFKKAKKYGYKYLEIVPYRWLNPEKVLDLEKKYNLQVVGIHLPQHWDLSWWGILKNEPTVFEGLFGWVWHFYQGKAAHSPGLKLAQQLKNQDRNPYVLIHANLLKEIPDKKLKNLSKNYNLVIENIPKKTSVLPQEYNPIEIKAYLKEQNLVAGLVFDHAHYRENQEKHSHKNPVEIYKQIRPEILHIGYIGWLPIFHNHILPNQTEQTELKKMLSFHQPQYITIETNPAVNPEKAKKLISKLKIQASA